VLVDNVRTVIGSVYIPPGDIKALDILESVIGRILKVHDSLIICMDGNSRNALWDNSCIGLNQIRKSVQMGYKLEDIIDKYILLIHNDGTATYRSTEV